MTNEALLFRSTDSLELAGDGRTIEGIAVRWNVEAPVSDPGMIGRYFESFDPKSANASLNTRGSNRAMFVRHAHLRGSLGETTFHVSAEGLMFRAHAFADSTLAREVLADGVGPHGRYPAVSIGFRSIKPRPIPRPKAGEHVHRLEIALEELSLAEVGQHPTAKVLAVRAEETDTPRLDALRRRMILLPRY